MFGKIALFRTLKDIWSDRGGLIVFVGLMIGLVVVTWGLHYSQSHQTVRLGEGIEVRVAGRCWYLKDDPEAGGKNQFWASNELGFNDMSMHPHFTLVNIGSEPREVSVHSLSAWRVPISGKVYLDPGQKFLFQIQARHKHWYCWIHPLSKKAT